MGRRFMSGGGSCGSPIFRQANGEGAMSLDDNKALVRWYLDELHRGNLGVLDEVLGPEYDIVDDGTPNTPGQRYRTDFGAFRRAFPDSHCRINTMIAEGEIVALHCTMSG